jgi:hypothetical protein
MNFQEVPPGDPTEQISSLPISCFLPESIDKCFMFYHLPSDASEWSRKEVIMLPGKAEAVDAVVY